MKRGGHIQQYLDQLVRASYSEYCRTEGGKLSHVKLMVALKTTLQLKLVARTASGAVMVDA